MHQQSPVAQQMGDWCGFHKHTPTQHTTKNKQTNTQTPEVVKQAGTGHKDAFGQHSCFPRWLNTLKGVNSQAKHKPWTNRQPTTHARVLVPCKVYRGSKRVQVCVSFLFLDDAGLRDCPSQDRPARGRTLQIHLPGPEDATLTALALRTCGRPRQVNIAGGGAPLRVSHFMDDQCFATVSGLRRRAQ